jgi:outer membrane protein assembly factor BamB
MQPHMPFDGSSIVTFVKTKLLSQGLLLSIAVGCSLRAEGQSWTLTSAPITNWVSVACSADGNKAAAVGAGLIYVTTNAGFNWTLTSAPLAPWVSVASSSDGVVLLAAEDDDFEGLAVYTSTNSGIDWIEGSGFGFPRAFACSADGHNVTGVGSPRTPMAHVGLIYTSTNTGVDWTSTGAPLASWQAVGCSSNGSNVFAGCYGSDAGGGPIYSSTNFGASWTQTTAPAKYWISMASSASGTNVVAAAHYDATGSSWPGALYVSADAGLSWHSSSPVAYWSGVASSSDGARLVAAAGSYPPYDDYTGTIYSSDDAGLTWVSNAAPTAKWSAVASSADGKTRFAAVYGGGIYTWHAPTVVPGTVLWTYSATNLISSSPAISPDGAICFGAGSALIAVTNSVAGPSNKWVFPVAQGQTVSSSPAIAMDGTVYFLNPSAGCYALNPDGSTKWSYPFQAMGLSSPAIGSDGTIYIVGDGSLYALTPSGAKKWAYNISSQQGSPAIAPDGTIYVATGLGSSLYAVNPDGTQKWTITGSGSSTGESAAIGANGTVYVGSGNLAAFAPDGSLLWSTQSLTNNFDQSSPVIGKGGMIYAVDESTRNLYAFSGGGHVVRTAAVGAGVRIGAVTAPAIDDAGAIYYCVSNSVVALSSTNEVQWLVGVNGPPQPGGSASVTSPVIAPDGTIYAALDATLYAIAGTNALGNTPWPMFRQNARHTGKMERPTLAFPQKRTDSNFAFQLYPNQLSLTYTIETSTNLNTWTTVTNVLATTLPTEVIDLTASNAPTRFYRASVTTN